MCTACDKLDTKMASGRRKRLWDLNSGWHCSILGTCLTLSDLRALGRKLSLHTRAGELRSQEALGRWARAAAGVRRGLMAAEVAAGVAAAARGEAKAEAEAEALQAALHSSQQLALEQAPPLRQTTRRRTLPSGSTLPRPCRSRARRPSG